MICWVNIIIPKNSSLLSGGDNNSNVMYVPSVDSRPLSAVVEKDLLSREIIATRPLFFYLTFLKGDSHLLDVKLCVERIGTVSTYSFQLLFNGVTMKK